MTRAHSAPYKLRALDIPAHGAVRSQRAEVLLAHLPEHIAQRELAVLKQGLGLADHQLTLRQMDDAYGPGNAVNVIIDSEHVCECFSAFGQRGVPAESVANEVVTETRHYLHAGVPVGRHLADQLLLPLALAGRGSFVTTQPSTHTLTNIEIIRAFTGLMIRTEEVGRDVWRISLVGQVAIAT